MRSFMLTGIRIMEMFEVPDPIIARSTDVLVRMKVVGVCGSDIHYFLNGRIGSQVVEYPFAVGHECAGEVVETGPGVTRVKVGDRVAIEPAMPCYVCDQCLAGRHHTCRELKFLGCPGQAPGCLSEYLVMPETSCFPVPDGMSYDQATLSEPIAIGLYSVRQSMPVEGRTAGILGFGPIGMSVLLAAQAKKCGNIYVTDRIDERLMMADASGAAWNGNPDREEITGIILGHEDSGLDIVYECCGKQEAMDQAVELVKPGGKIVIVGIPEFDRWSFCVDNIRRKEITLLNIRRQNHALEETLELLACREFDADPMVTHRFPFERADDAFRLVAAYGDGVMKAMIDFTGV